MTAMKKPRKRNILLSGHISSATEKKIRRVIEESGDSIQLEGAPAWAPISEYDIVQVIDKEYVGKEDDLRKIVDIPAIVEELNMPDVSALMKLNAGTKDFIRAVLKHWIFKNRPDLVQDFPFCSED
jgi:hypothetical protein